MDKKEFIIGQIAKTNKKNYENYIITRIINLINDFDLKFITQQPVILRHGKRALTDLYFPQINFHVEIDEAYHKRQTETDISREADIINITGHVLKRIDVAGNIDYINRQIEKVVKEVKHTVNSKKKNGQFIRWDIKAELKSDTYVKRRFIDLKDNVVFKRIVDACNCFGLHYKGYQKASAKHPIEKDKSLWFPKFYENEHWDNRISDDGRTIWQISKSGKYCNDIYKKDPYKKRIVFARVKGPMGNKDIMYRFKGLFEMTDGLLPGKTRMIYKRISKKVKTYKPAKN